MVRTVIASVPIAFTGAFTTFGELYRQSGASAARRPPGTWRASANQQVTLFNELHMGVDLLFSSEGNQVRQSVDQFGLNPSYRWVTLHVGDFTRDYSSYTMTGTRIRGGGIDLKPGDFRFSLQGGRAQRTVAAGSDGAAYRRDLIAATVGYGRDGGNRIALTVLKGKDDPNSLEQRLIVVDSTLSDTSIIGDKLRFATTPQENLVAGLDGELNLFEGRVHFTGQAGASLFTRDLRSQTIGDNGVGTLGPVSALQPLRLSTSGDAAFMGDLDLRLGNYSLRGGYEQIGAGYTSLGLQNLINDQRGFHLGGGATFFDGRVAVQGETRQQANNLVDQKVARTSRNMTTGSLALALSPKLTTAITVVSNIASTDGSDVTPAVLMHTIAITTAVQSRLSLFTLPTTASLSYSYQHSWDGVPHTSIPATLGDNVTASITSQFSPSVTAGPSLSFVTNNTGGVVAPSNLLLGFNVRTRGLWHDRVTLAGNLSNTFSGGRQVSAGKAEFGYVLPWESRLLVQARHSTYSAFAGKPAFNESFLTTTVSRSLSLGGR